MTDTPATTASDDARPGGAGGTSTAAEIGPEWELLQDVRTPGLVRRFFTTWRHVSGLLLGGLVSSVRSRLRQDPRPEGLTFRLQRIAAALVRPFLDRKLRELPFPVQFRRRLEILGPTYIKLGQILSLREDLLPDDVTTELKNLLDRLPIVPFERYAERVARGLDRPIDAMFTWVDPRPLGSASIAQIHRARTLEGDDVILKVIKPGVRGTLKRDAVLLQTFGRFLQLFLSRYQPRRVIAEFVHYTLREVDLRREADNAETFAANFKDVPGVVFPKIYRKYSSETVLCMEFLDGFKPSDPRARELSASERDLLVDLGASAIIRMLYKDGFFHADLHPANLIVLPGPKCGFIDLGMVGRFDDELRRTMLYYFYCLVMGDAENAARYLASVAHPAPGSDPTGFRREVEEIARRWARASSFEQFSIAQLILESLGVAGHFRMYFPVELILMVKALVTFEGVGHMLKTDIDVAAVSRSHVNGIFLSQFNPLRIARESLRGAPEVVDALVKAPLLVTEGLRFLEKTTRQPPENPFAGMRGTMFAGFCLVAAAILAALGGPWPLWVALFALAFLIAVRRPQ